MPKKKASKKRGELDNKTLAIIIIAVVVIIIGVIVIFSYMGEAPEEDDNQNIDNIVDVKNCPEELYKTKINVFPRDRGDDSFPNRLNVYDKDYVEGKGDYVGLCGVALNNPDHSFCTSTNTLPNYIRLQEIVDGKIVRPQERWYVDITFDHTTCEEYSKVPASGLPIYACDIVDVSCHQ